MEAKAKFLGHSIHAMLIAFPLGLLATAVIFDVAYLVTNKAMWTTVACYLIGAGVVGGLTAAVFGLIDYSAIPASTRARRVGRMHGIGNVVVVLLFGYSWWARHDAPQSPSDIALACSFAGIALAAVTAWLGGELVERLGVGVDDGAHVDAPSSLSRQPTSAAALHRDGPQTQWRQ
jgi:uncharacterized membrane protein